MERCITEVSRRTFVGTLALGVVRGAFRSALADDKPLDPAQAKPDANGALLFYDLLSIGLEGKGWSDTKAPYDRFPTRAEGVVPAAVWGLSRQSAGLCARFVTNATVIHARWTLTSANLALPHMPATGVSGLDLYTRDTEKKRWLWVGNGRPTAQTNTAVLATGLPPGKREFMLYLPLYNGVSSVEVGLAKDASLWNAPPRPRERQRPIIFYGTSITQGGCASRPGMVHTAILGRRLEWAVINLGFSGNGRMDLEVVKLIAEIEAAAYVIDCLPNMDAQAVADRTEPLVRTLRAARPTTPILLVEDRTYQNAYVLPGPRQRNNENRAALRKVYDQLIAAGVKGLHYLEGENLLGDDGEATVDSSHPTDLGFVRQADAMEKALRPLLSRPR